MRLSEWAESFRILALYGDEDHQVCAEHDVVTAGPDGVTFEAMRLEDANRLIELDWTENPDGGFDHFAQEKP